MNRRGFAQVVVFLILAGLVVIGGVFYFTGKRAPIPTQPHSQLEATSTASDATGTDPASSSAVTTSVPDFCDPDMSGMTDLPPLPSDFNWTPLSAANATSVVSYSLSFSSSTGELISFDAFEADLPPFSRKIGGNAWFIQGSYKDHASIEIDYYAPVLKRQGWARRLNFAGHQFDGMDASGYGGDDQGYIKIQNDQIRALTVDYVHSDSHPNHVIVFVSDIIPLSEIIPGYKPSCPDINSSPNAINAALNVTSTSPVSSLSLTPSAPVQLDGYILKAYCKINNNYGSVDHVGVASGTILVQTIGGFWGSRPFSNGVCPSPDIQDVNFDGYPDFMIHANAGSGGDSVYYELFNITTQQFYCPGGSSVGAKSISYCSFMNPVLDPSSKTISTWTALGASNQIDQLYKINGDTIYLYQETDITSSATATLKTVKRLQDGKMVVVSTSTDPAGN